MTIEITGKDIWKTIFARRSTSDGSSDVTEAMEVPGGIIVRVVIGNDTRYVQSCVFVHGAKLEERDGYYEIVSKFSWPDNLGSIIGNSGVMPAVVNYDNMHTPIVQQHNGDGDVIGGSKYQVLQ